MSIASSARGGKARRQSTAAESLSAQAARLSAAVAMAALLALAQPASAVADWPIFGHDLANARSAGSDGPSAREAASMQRAWQFDSSNGDFTGTPVVSDGVLVAGTNLGSIYALDAATGKLLWSRDVGQEINGSAAIDPNAPGGPTVYVPVAQIGEPRLIALSLSTGAIRWDAVLTRQADSDVFGSPVYWRGTLYIGTSGPGNDQSTARGSVVALDEATGGVRWQTFTVPPGDDGGGVWSTPAIDPATGRLYVGTGNAYHDPAADTTDSMMVMSASTGETLGHFQSTPGDVWELSNPSGGPDYDFGASPNLITGSNGEALVGEGQKSGTYWALDRATMKPVWQTTVGPGSQADGGIGSSAYDGTRVYGSDSASSQVFALGRDGSSQWSSLDGGTLHVSPVAVGNGVLYSATSTGLLVARDTSSGSVLSRLSLGGPTLGGISVVGHAVFVAVGVGPPSPILPLPTASTQQGDGNGSIVAFGDPTGAAASPNDFTLRFSSDAPATPTGARLHAVVHRSSPNAKPSALRSEVLDLPPGSRFDGSAVPACAASDSQIQAQGPSACPASSEVGSGTITVMIGSPLDPETADVSIFNWGHGTIEVVTAPGTDTTLAIDRGTFTAPNELTNHPPQAPGGPPDFETSVSAADFDYRAIDNARRHAFITTPSSCPADGSWTSRVAYSTADGRSYSATTGTPCRRPPSGRTQQSPRPSSPAAIRVAVRPARAVAGRPIRIAVRLSSADPRCVRGATVRLGRARARTGPGGRALLAPAKMRAGRQRVVAAKPGCRSGVATVLVVRRRASNGAR